MGIKVTTRRIEIKQIDKQKYLDELKSLGNWDVERLLPVPEKQNLGKVRLEFMSAVIKYSVDVVQTNEEMLDIFYATREIFNKFKEKITGAELVEDFSGNPLYVNISIDCNEEEWDEAIEIIQKYPQAVGLLGVVCEKALFDY